MINNKSYVGSSINLSTRLRTYYSYISINKKLKKASSKIYSAILKYGHSNFSLDILEYCDKSILIEREQYYLDLLKPEYNILKTANSRLGHYLSEETKKAISITSTGRKHTDETIQKLRNINKTISLKTKLKLASRSLGVKVEITDPLLDIKHEFSTMSKAAKYLGIKRDILGKIFDNNTSYKN
jgi:group I intron endonuclease